MIGTSRLVSNLQPRMVASNNQRPKVDPKPGRALIARTPQTGHPIGRNGHIVSMIVLTLNLPCINPKGT